jgi:opacity protein-like surface antigen
MQKPILTLFLITGLFAQGGFTIVGGLNLGSVQYNDSDVADLFDISMKVGLNIGAETAVGPLKVGGALVQRGAKMEMSFLGETFTGSDTYNYLTAYGIYPYAIKEGISAFGGLQLGKAIGGTSEFDGDSETLNSDDFALDYGLLIGLDYMINTKMGVRASYYLGLADVIKDVDSDFNFKNTGIGLALLYNL